MTEYLSEAIVLSKEPNGDLDSRVSLFTKKFGKIKAKAKSARRITSKLSAHLEPGNLIHARMIEKNGLQVVDALKRSAIPVSSPKLFALDGLLAEFEPDFHLWRMLEHGPFRWADVLAILGWDPRGAHCALCERPPVSHFDARSQTLLCEACAPPPHLRGAGGHMIYLGDDEPDIP